MLVALVAVVAAPWAASGAASESAQVAGKNKSKGKKGPKPHRYKGKKIATTPGCDFILPQPCLEPWPNDYFTVSDKSTDTGRRLNLRASAMPTNATDVPIDPTDMNRSDGFSPGQVIVVKIPQLNSQQAFNANGLVPITDPGAYSDKGQRLVVINAKTHKRQPVWAEIDSQATDPSQVSLLIHPARNFTEGARYIVALRGLRAGGQPIKAPTGFKVYRDRLITKQKPVEKRRKHMESLFSDLGKAKIKRSNLYLSWDFTVSSADNISARVLAMRDDALTNDLHDPNIGNGNVNDGNSPSFTVDTVTPNPNPDILRQVDGTLTNVPCYLDTDGCPTGSQFDYGNAKDRTPNFHAGFTMDVPFRCVIPNAVTNGVTVTPSRPAEFGHGLLGGYEDVSSNGERMNALANEHNVTVCAVDWAGFADEDIGTVIGILQDLSKFPQLADRVQQAYVNFIYLGRAIMHNAGFNTSPAFQVDPADPMDAVNGGAGVFNTSKLFFEGISQGAIEGGALSAVSPDISRSALNVGAMNYSVLLNRSSDWPTYESVLGYTDDKSEEALVLSMIQVLWDRAETNGYSQHIVSNPYEGTPAKQILLQADLGDFQVANVQAEVAARTMRLKVYDGGPTPNGSMLVNGRHWGTNPLFGMKPIPSFPYTGSALVYWDGGPPAYTGVDGIGTATPPTTNTAPVEAGPGNVPLNDGTDPHSYSRKVAAARTQISDFFNGSFGPCAGGGPCFSNGWDGVAGL